MHEFLNGHITSFIVGFTRSVLFAILEVILAAYLAIGSVTYPSADFASLLRGLSIETSRAIQIEAPLWENVFIFWKEDN